MRRELTQSKTFIELTSVTRICLYGSSAAVLLIISNLQVYYHLVSLGFRPGGMTGESCLNFELAESPGSWYMCIEHAEMKMSRHPFFCIRLGQLEIFTKKSLPGKN